MHEPHFSVIIPTHNRPERLLACIAGLAVQAFPRARYEVLVVNDGGHLPPRADLDRVGGDVGLRVLPAPRQGPALARNTGAASARGRYLAFIDDDCVPDPRWLSALAGRFEQAPDALVGGRTVNALVDNLCAEATQVLVEFLAVYYDGSAPGRTRFFATSNLAVAAEGFRVIGGFDPQFRCAAGEDRDFCDRWHLGGGDSTLAEDAVVYHHHRLGLHGYLAQHFRYGRGALRFHRARRSRGAGTGVSPFGFYLELVRYTRATRPALHATFSTALLMAAQAATAAGYVWEAASAGPLAARP